MARIEDNAIDIALCEEIGLDPSTVTKIEMIIEAGMPSRIEWQGSKIMSTNDALDLIERVRDRVGRG